VPLTALGQEAVWVFSWLCNDASQFAKAFSFTIPGCDGDTADIGAELAKAIAIFRTPQRNQIGTTIAGLWCCESPAARHD
jgi:hypothetical protein